MAKYLVQTVETWRFDTEDEAQRYLQEQREDCRFEVKKSSCEKKENKKEEEEWIRCTVTKVFNVEKEPCLDVKVTYDTAPSFVKYGDEDEE